MNGFDILFVIVVVCLLMGVLSVGKRRGRIHINPPPTTPRPPPPVPHELPKVKNLNDLYPREGGRP